MTAAPRESPTRLAEPPRALAPVRKAAFALAIASLVLALASPLVDLIPSVRIARAVHYLKDDDVVLRGDDLRTYGNAHVLAGMPARDVLPVLLARVRLETVFDASVAARVTAISAIRNRTIQRDTRDDPDEWIDVIARSLRSKHEPLRLYALSRIFMDSDGRCLAALVDHLGRLMADERSKPSEVRATVEALSTVVDANSELVSVVDLESIGAVRDYRRAHPEAKLERANGQLVDRAHRNEAVVWGNGLLDPVWRKLMEHPSRLQGGSSRGWFDLARELARWVAAHEKTLGAQVGR